jgi:hypothetical protein
MDINFDKIKSGIGIFITVASALVSVYIAGKNYLDTSFVSAKEFENIKARVIISQLENRKFSLENRLYLLDICSRDVKCTHYGAASFEIERTKRELDDTRGQLETVKRKLLSE